MKNIVRVLSLLFVLMLSVATFAHAETFDISALSYDELIALHKQVSLAIMQSDEWKEVTVPIGTYVIGEDIPAGDYTVTYTGRVQSCLYIYPDIKSVGSYDFSLHILNPSVFDSGSIGKLSLSDGQVIDIQYGSVVFTPYTGLGF